MAPWLYPGSLPCRRPLVLDSLTTKGTYALVLECTEPAEVSVGALGVLELNPGVLVYVGSAFGSGGLAGRLRHHLLPVTRPHWHLDYIRPHVALQAAWCVAGPRSLEHDWARAVADIRGFSVPLSGFGSSDCNCVSHLLCSNHGPHCSRLGGRLANSSAGLQPDYFPVELLRQILSLAPLD